MWLSYWCVFGVFQTVEMYIGFFLSYIPFYNLIRFTFFLFLMMPQTQGAKIIYSSVLKPLLVKYKPQIEEFIARVSEKASEASKEGMAFASDKAKEFGTAENALKANAMMTDLQTKMDDKDAKKEEQ